MMKLPSKDPVTIPWMTKREIPAIKAVLSAWREMRKGWKADGFTGNMFEFTQQVAEDKAKSAAYNCEIIAMIDEALRENIDNDKG